MQIPVNELIHLLHEAPHAVLSTQSVTMPGFPFGTVVPLVVDGGQRPILLISALAEHTRNLLQDSRASLTLLKPGNGNVQESERATLVGEFREFTPTPAQVARYLRYQPDAEQHLEMDFSFFRMDIVKTRYIGGIGRMGWLTADDWRDAFLIDETIEAGMIATIQQQLPPSIRVLGIDACGVDHEIAGTRARHRFNTTTDADQFADDQTAWPSDWPRQP